MLVNWKEWDFVAEMAKYNILEFKKRKKDQRNIIEVYCAFDIECSTVWINPDPTLYDVHSFMYSWQFQIEDITILGNDWDDFIAFLKCLRGAIDAVGDNLSIIIWVHNLAYEFTFLSGIYDFKNEECFFRDVRKPIYVRMFAVFEFRCSYIQTNLSLKKLCEQMKVPVKLSGQKFNYDKIRFPWTPLTDFEKEYIITDVSSLVQAMKKRVIQGGDTLLTVPLTSTGYVRRECKESLKDKYLDMRSLKPSEDVYRLLRKAFRGGNTHANRHYVGQILENVYSYDIASSYPTQQLTQKFPMKPFKFLPNPVQFERCCLFMGLGYAVVGLYQFKNISLKNLKEPIPYISLSRCDSYNFILDNGRILEAEYVEIALTEIDLQIVLDQYTFDEIGVLQCMVAQKDYLPEEYRKVIQSYYDKKTALKGDDSEDGQYMYMKSKNMLNSVYGMSATDPIHQEIFYNGGDYTRSSYETMTAKEKELALKNAPFPYQWGVYTTAYARQQLQEAIKICGSQIVYCDTDSVKTLGDVPIHKLNEKYKKNADRVQAFADDMNGKRHYIGLFENDGHYDRFITQGAKRYAYESNGKMGITVAGVTKQINEKTEISFAVEELRDLRRFKPGMKWKKAGGTMAVYNDEDDFEYQDPDTGRTVHISKNVAIVPSTYVMTYAKDYKELLENIQLYGQYKKERE